MNIGAEGLDRCNEGVNFYYRFCFGGWGWGGGGEFSFDERGVEINFVSKRRITKAGVIYIVAPYTINGTEPGGVSSDRGIASDASSSGCGTSRSGGPISVVEESAFTLHNNGSCCGRGGGGCCGLSRWSGSCGLSR